MSANVNNVSGATNQLDKRTQPDEQVTEDQVQDPGRLTRLLMRLLRDVAALQRRWWPQRIDFEDVAVDSTGTTKYRFPHKFGGRVRFWIVGCTSAAAAPCLVQNSDTDNNTLVVVSTVAATITLRVEEAG